MYDMDAKEVAREAEQVAIDRIAQSQGLITDIKGQQRNVIHELFANAGGDGVGLMDDSVMQQSFAQAEKDASMREGRFDAGARVAVLPGNVVGQENDATRTVLIDTSMAQAETPKAQAVEVNVHEFRHKIQDRSNDEGSDVPVTGDARIDKMLGTEHLAFREEDAMFAAGKVFTAQSYTTKYEQPVQRIASFLSEHGRNGANLVREAGLNGKMREVRSALLEVFVEEQLQNYANN